MRNYYYHTILMENFRHRNAEWLAWGHKASMIELRFKLKPLQFSQLLISTACTFYCSCCLLAQSCPTLCDPMDITCQAPLSMGFSRQEYCSGLPFPFPGCMVLRGGKPRISLMGAVVKKNLTHFKCKAQFYIHRQYRNRHTDICGGAVRKIG